MARKQIKDAGQGTAVLLGPWQDGASTAPVVHYPLHNIADVSQASGLPCPVIMQLVPRTRTAQGYMYTGEQLQAAVRLAGELRRERTAALRN